MKSRLMILVASMLCATTIMAVPAYRGWQTKTQPDGTTLEVRLNGDEYYHYYTNRAGEVVKADADGYWQVVEQQPTQETIAARRAKSPMKRSGAKKVGSINLAPRGLFILVNFKDASFKSSNTTAQMDSMMNAVNYTYGGSYGSARKYFSDQSNGAYKPIFDVVGPVTLSYNTSHYGANDSDDNDKLPADMVIEACKLADTKFNVDFTKYDNDDDGYIDFVYIIYAGKGEADGGAENTIWPHNWSVQSAIYYNSCSYTESQSMVDGLYIDDYACSGELDGQTGARNGIGTLCHEFSHVLGLPDYYDTKYKTNYDDGLTPNEWDIMDSGSYNGNGLCPPNFSIHEKYTFGWATPVNPGSKGQLLTLNAAGTKGYNAYQINASGTLQAATYEGVNYYIENRQQTGWDTYLPGHGMLVWYVNYSSTAWDNNTPNNTANNPRYTLISATGSKKNIGISDDDADYDADADPYPGTKSNTTWNSISSKPVTNITESSDGVISCVYIKNPNATTWDYEVVYENCTVSSESGTVKKGAQLQLTITPKNGYVINSSSHLDVTMDETTLTWGKDFTYENNILTIPAVTGDVEILVIPGIAPAKPYTVQWVADGDVIEEQGYDEGDSLSMPSATPVACDGMTFVGWTAQEDYYDPFNTPADLFTTATGKTVNANVTYYAVYQ